MTSSTGLPDRDVVPRWRNIIDTLRVESSFPAVTQAPVQRWQVELLNQRRLEFETNRSESYAMELSGTQRAFGTTGFAEESDRHLISIGKMRWAESVDIGESNTPPQVSPALLLEPLETAKAEIAHYRERLKQDPRRAISWSELARNYAILGLHERARRACLTAIQLAPDSRYILRSAACFFWTIGEEERAWVMLHRAENVNQDPWLKSAELALGRSLKKSPNGVRQARQLLGDTNFSPRDLSELSSEVGTFEMDAGNRRARRHFQEAVINPTENSLAQVQWAKRKDSDLVIPSSDQGQPSASEANSLKAQREGDWETAVREARAWQFDQPFSPDAARTVSCLLSMGLDDCKASFLAANLGLKSNPDDAILHNNAAYALIELGDLEKAKLELSKIDMGKISNYEYVTASATWGLYYFRNGQLELGRKHYERSLDIARNLPNSEWEAMASVMFAREEILLGNEAARELLSKAERAAARTDSALIRRWLEIDKRLIGTSLKS